MIRLIILGSLKVWDFGSGQDIKWREGHGSDDDHSVLGLQYCQVDEERCIAALGWNNHLQLFLVSTYIFKHSAV